MAAKSPDRPSNSARLSQGWSAASSGDQDRGHGPHVGIVEDGTHGSDRPGEAQTERRHPPKEPGHGPEAGTPQGVGWCGDELLEPGEAEPRHPRPDGAALDENGPPFSADVDKTELAELDREPMAHLNIEAGGPK